MNIFQQLFRMAESCMVIRFTQLCMGYMSIFEQKYFTRWCSDAFEVWCDV